MNYRSMIEAQADPIFHEFLEDYDRGAGLGFLAPLGRLLDQMPVPSLTEEEAFRLSKTEILDRDHWELWSSLLTGYSVREAKKGFPTKTGVHALMGNAHHPLDIAIACCCANLFN